ncbi:MAG: hypothetical protein K2X38_07655 [Gemmataceae bacterium]|nr:hypothetical protein [Gemmataceae bacterium]
MDSSRVLEVLHDAVCTNIRFDIADSVRRRIELSIRMSDACGDPTYAGATLRLGFVGVAAVNYFGAYYCASPETIDGWSWSVSPAFEKRLHDLLRLGIPCGGLLGMLQMHTGTCLELSFDGCEAILEPGITAMATAR